MHYMYCLRLSEYGGKWKMLHYLATKFFSRVFISPYIDDRNITVYYIDDGVYHSEFEHGDKSLRPFPVDQPFASFHDVSPLPGYNDSRSAYANQQVIRNRAGYLMSVDGATMRRAVSTGCVVDAAKSPSDGDDVRRLRQDDVEIAATCYRWSSLEAQCTRSIRFAKVSMISFFIQGCT